MFSTDRRVQKMQLYRMKTKHRAKKLLCRVTLLWYRFNIIIQSFRRG